MSGVASRIPLITRALKAEYGMYCKNLLTIGLMGFLDIVIKGTSLGIYVTVIIPRINGK